VGERDYPAFSAAEMTRRRAALTEVLAERAIDAVLVYGFDRSGTAVPWLTGWPVTREAALLFRPDERDLLFVCYDNHVPNARRLARDADVRPGGRSALAAALGWLTGQHVPLRRLGVIGPVPARAGPQLAAAAELVFLDAEYTRLRLLKSAQEISWLRRGAQLSDDAVAALARSARPGMTEAQCCASLESAYIAAGGLTQIHYLGVTPMAQPDLCVPAQWPSARPLQPGDALSCEVSASYHGYAGQLLRTFTIAAEPSPLYRDLHEVAEAAFDAVASRLRPGARAGDLTEAGADVILGAGYTIYDDLVHGYGGGYLPPVLSRAELEARQAPDFTFEAGMTVVIQPNVITRDERAGVQTGELVLVTGTGWESLHTYPRGLTRVGG
jgi:Xaa-Pro aminopeptidase